jgi:LmbE family N-acetylglucosaminyl deacetylase
MHYFLSPHLDDVALSCSGHVHQLVKRGGAVMIVSVCTGDTPVGVTLSEAARHVHGEWRLGENNPYAARRDEDHAACAALGATPVHLGFPDAVYRHDAHGAPLYTRDFIGGLVREQDWRTFYFALAERLRAVVPPQARVYCPLAIGGHVDHVLVRGAAELALPGRLSYYEDYPYAQKVGQGNARVAAEVNALTRGLNAWTVALAADDVQARIDAIALYRSQQFALFEQAETMPAKVREYVALSGGERYYT